MKTNLNKAYMTEILELLLRTPSPTGYTHHIMQKVEQEVNKLGFELTYTNKGCGIVTIPGTNQNRVIGISAHVDTLGAMVRSIKDNGTLKITSLGGFMMGAIENEYVQIHTRDERVYDGTILTSRPSVHVYEDAREYKRDEANMEVRIDELVKSKKEVQDLGIRVGDYISFDPRVQVKENGFVKSRHLDDKASVASLFGLLKLIKDEGLKPEYTIKLFFSNYEEVGHGSSFIPDDITDFIAVDMGALGDDLSGSERDVSICAKDSSGPYDYQMTSKMIELAEKLEIGYAVDIYPRYGSDASAALRGGRDIRAALIGPGVHASHSMERTHMDAVVNTAALLVAYIMEPAHA
ncbi:MULTISPECIES: M42 family metallopeptidase [unclassified Paenibacillus]|uniref:M42 family metallopeptidase n=1 Tax=unclassified Paenibacillus TaxID=185978 RepID=UPI0027811E77|nr:MULTISPECIES: M42 family metallopeptidase [unclassified Paenibacillus]MDQ0898604.1 putative aminopeptidase FrvX [Paenibacillus sp. V4I7]MDQ0915405.1 putative aminopeptidase FrvX [Paenibacillus sp. V4I5]